MRSTGIQNSLQRSGLFAAAALLGVACSTPDVGAPCMPEQIPQQGFNEAETYIETGSAQCQTRVCIVHHMRGTPKGTGPCVDETTQSCAQGDTSCASIAVCASPQSVVEHAYCSCACVGVGAHCACPDGFSCAREPGPGQGYCIRNGT